MVNWFIIIILLLILWLLIHWGLKACAAAQEIDWGKPWLNYLDGLNRLFCKHYHGLRYMPLDLPAQGSALVMANHISGLDPLLMVAASRRPLRFIIAREQYERFGLNWLFRAVGCIPVDRDRHPERALWRALRALEAGEVVALFPQGTIVLLHESRKLKRGGIWLAQRTQSPIYPVYISGIQGVGHIFRGVIFKSQASLVSHSSFYWQQDSDVDYLRALLEGRPAASRQP